MSRATSARAHSCSGFVPVLSWLQALLQPLSPPRSPEARTAGSAIPGALQGRYPGIVPRTHASRAALYATRRDSSEDWVSVRWCRSDAHRVLVASERPHRGSRDPAQQREAC